MVIAPILVLPNFKEEFIIETNASGIGLGAVVMQQGHPIAYISKTLAPKHQGLSAYEKELLAVVYAVEKWRPYLIGKHFTIKIDHFSSKYLLEQKISTPEIMETVLSTIDSELLKKIQNSWVQDQKLQKIISALSANPQSYHKYSRQQELLRTKGKLVVGKEDLLRQHLIKLIHNSPFGRHSGVEVTTKKLSSWFYWKGMKEEVRNWVCEVCQRCKPCLQTPAGTLQPPPIPHAIWVDISMDFIKGLPTSRHKDTILVEVDRLSKYAHFLALSHPFTAAGVAQSYFEHIFKLILSIYSSCMVYLKP